MRNRVMKPMSWMMILLLLFQWSGASAIPEAQRDAAVKQEEIDRAFEKLERIFDALEDIAKEIPRDTFDPQAIVDKVGKDPIALFEWVRDNTYFVPYRGILRGPIGVLMDRRGNSLDRAALLHRLFAISGHDARLVKGFLDERQPQEVWRRWNRISLPPPFASEQTRDAKLRNAISRYGQTLGLQTARLEAFSDGLVFSHQLRLESIAQRVSEQSEALLPLFESVSFGAESESASDLAPPQDHWWIEYIDSEKWIALDPTFQNAQAGRSIGVGHFKFRNLDDLPKSNWHRLTIRVVIERWSKGQFAEETVLERTLTAAKLFGKSICLRHLPVNLRPRFGRLTGVTSIKQFKHQLLENSEWLPVLTVGSMKFWDHSFSNTGAVNPSPGTDFPSQMSDSLRQNWSLFGPAQAVDEQPSFLTAERIEYEVASPGQGARTETRQVFDISKRQTLGEQTALETALTLDARVDRALALLGEYHIAVQTCDLSTSFLAQWIVRGLLSSTQAARDDKSVMGTELPPKDNGLEAVFADLPSPAYSLALVRTAWNDRANPVFIRSPNVICFKNRLRFAKNGELLLSAALDIVRNDVAVASGSPREQFRLALRQGVFDTNAEALLLSNRRTDILNAAEIFAKDQASDGKWRIIKDQKNVDAIGSLSSVSNLGLKAELDRGFFLLAREPTLSAQGDSHAIWWRVNPQTGVTLGIVDSAGGQAGTEYPITKLLVSWAAFSNCMAQGFLTYEEEEAQALAAIKCVVAFAAFGVPAISGKETTISLFLWLVQQTIEGLMGWVHSDLPGR